MKVKLIQLANAQAAFDRLMGEKLPVRAAYRVGKLARLIGEELQSFHTIRNDLVQKYGVQEGEQYVVKTERLPDFMAEFGPLADEEVELNVMPLLPTELGEVRITPADLLALDWLILDA